MSYRKGAPQNSKDNAKKEQLRVLDYNAFAKKQLLGYAKKGCPFYLPKDSRAIVSLQNLNLEFVVLNDRMCRVQYNGIKHGRSWQKVVVNMTCDWRFWEPSTAHDAPRPSAP
eukprot:5267357-Amphidinium_carterae.2